MDNNGKGRVLIVDDDNEIRYSLDRVLTSRGYEVGAASSGEEGIEKAGQGEFDVIFLDNRMEGMSGLETLQHLRNSAPESMVVFMTAFGTTQTAIEAMKYGAFDYIIKPFELKRTLALTEKAVLARRDLQRSRTDYAPILNSEDYKEGIVGDSQPMQEVFKAIGQVATSDVTVMITGESGTGKELVARCIHQHSLRSAKPFMAVNCAAIPDNLIESELFGHEKGAFTGATQQRMGKFELCDGGTLFLDEIGDMALPTQTKILRALQEGEVQRVGGEGTVRVNVRLIAATNRDLEKLVEKKAFREDLYYRLNVMRIRLPSLRDRLSDVPALVDFMLQRLRKERKSRVRNISPEALKILSIYPWPGNVRELENAVHRSVVVAQGDTVLKTDLPGEILAQCGEAVADPVEAAPGSGAEGDGAAADAFAEGTRDQLLDRLYSRLRTAEEGPLLPALEKEMARRALEETGGNQARASTILGITRATLRKRIDAYGLAEDL
ncbi:MAG: response regulator [Verrucomicrobia bacterium]|jgi:two-component system nitrogen regulation response regulator GlnG|nr:response regulator [Verrucomicrobiota bacterium]